MRLNRGAKVVLGGITLWLALYWILYYLAFLYLMLQTVTWFQGGAPPGESIRRLPLLRLILDDPAMFFHLALMLLLSIFYGMHFARARVSGEWPVKALAAAGVTIVLMFIMPFGIVLYYWIFIWRPPTGSIQSRPKGA